MIPMEHLWTEWQEENISPNNLFSWKWKDNTPNEIKEQYKEWIEYYNKKMNYNNIK